MSNILIYAGAGVVGMLWGAGYAAPDVVLAFIAGLWLGAGGGVDKWAVLALIAGYVAGSILLARRRV
jgi:hypothetical protein